jgi:hypothetical protein
MFAEKSGIIIPDTARERPQKGRVIAVGPGRPARSPGGEVAMTDVAHKVLTGFARLSYSDQHEVIEAMNRFLAGTSAEQSRLRKEYEESVMGPVGSSCPCCAAAQKSDAPS